MKTIRLAALAALLLSAHASPAAIKYILTDLGTLGGASKAYGINASGQVVGADTNGHAFIYQNGAMADLNSLTDANSGWTLNDAKAINASGQVVGFGYGDHHGAYLYQNGTVTDLGTFPSAANLSSVSQARGLNDAGQVVGDAWTATGEIHAFLYSNGTMADLGTLGGTDSRAYGINSTGQVVGGAQAPSGSSHAFLFQNGTMSDLGTLGGASSVARAINDAGLVVGEASDSDGNIHAFAYQNGTMSDLGTFAGGGPSRAAYAVNSKGQIVGKAEASPGSPHAFICENGAMTDLNTLIDPSIGWTVEEAFGINDSGQIVGYGSGPGPKGTHAFLLTPGTPSSPTPAIPVLALSGKKKTTTDKSKLVIKGTAKGEVASVTYRVGSKGAYKKAAGTNAWKFTVKLKPGKNVVTVIAHGPGGDSAPLKVIVMNPVKILAIK